MEISIVKNCVRRTQNVSSNVVVANRVMSNGRQERIELRSIPGHNKYYADIDRGIVYGHFGTPVGSKRRDGRMIVFCGKNNGKAVYKLRSRLIASAALGRELNSDEQVDHVNNIITDDRISNLNVCDAKSNANNPLTRTLMKNKTRRRNTSERIEVTGAVSHPHRTYNVKKSK